ncbi:Gfo/Idh/MocA family protein [Croceivirga thetidis]|uniref:Gfo/Idh/MocA family oxidoreductase n=1 Tax=Croceivirga thetidis TaxID=2721623 RepID=A0ABX1GN94_9FLAO|nr:Gfo/Idh/MocA family oxidoreductase [Croceivirga thetidis]NKI30450.1 Gfo/Idh/MocA family oxidoreductase [Croceivirga thetidis]
MIFGVLGGGMIARFHAMAIEAIEGAELGGIYARNPEKAKALGEEFNCPFYSELSDFLNNPDIAIITIATPSGAHLEPSLLAAKAGKHIICEKPLEINPERIQQMINAAEEAGVVLSGIFNRRFNPALQELKTAVKQNRFGQLTLCDAQIKWYRDQAYYDSGAWRGTWQFDGGGALMNQAIHTIDQLLYVVGPVNRLSASVATLTHTGVEVEDTAVALLEFENGAKGTIQASTGCFSSEGHPAQIQICGEHGSVFLKDEKFSVWDFKNGLPVDDKIRNSLMEGDEKPLGANDPNTINYIGHQRNFEDVIDAIKNNRQPLISGKEAMKSVKLITAIYESAKNNGAWITL